MKSHFLALLAMLALGLAGGWLLRGAPPPTPVEPREGPATAGPRTVHLDEAQRRSARIELAAVRIREVREGFDTTGSLAADPDLEARVTARLAGRLQGPLASVGDRVSRGEVLGRLESTEAARALGEYRQATVRLAAARKALENRRRLVTVSESVRGPLERARQELAAARGALEAARARRLLAEQKLTRLEDLRRDGIASEQQVEEARAELRSAVAAEEGGRAGLEVAQAREERERESSASGVATQSELLGAAAEVDAAAAEAERARDALRVLGLSPGDSPTLLVASPRGGLVVARLVSEGESVAEGAELFRVVDPARLWVWADVREPDLPRVREGTEADVRAGGTTVSGRVTWIAPELDPTTRAARARVEIGNPEGRLLPGMFAQVRLRTGAAVPAVWIPRDAVQMVGEEQVAYVARSSDEFERRVLELGESRGDEVRVQHGLSPGERIVVRGAFSVKSKDLEGQLEEGEE